MLIHLFIHSFIVDHPEDEEGESPPTTEREPPNVDPSARKRSEEEEIPDPIMFRGRQHPGWRSVRQGIEQRHQDRHQAFRTRRKEVNQGIYVESGRASIITPGEGLPEKGTEEWIRLRETNWKEEAKILVETFKWWKKCGGRFWKDREEKREWSLKQFGIPFIRYPSRDDQYEWIKDMPEIE
jgi:hypothetical protein